MEKKSYYFARVILNIVENKSFENISSLFRSSLCNESIGYIVLKVFFGTIYIQ
jgi:hypothetical protein